MICEFPELLSKEIIERANKLATTLLCDGMEALGIRDGGCMEASISPIEPSMRMIGTAVTVETGQGDNLPIHRGIYNTPSEGYVMVIDGKDYEGNAYFGDLIMGVAKAIGYQGMVINGYTRDREGNIELQFPVFSKGLIPRGPKKENHGCVNKPITCGGITINPGDLIMGDCDGVCVVPKERIQEVLEKAEEKLKYENKRLETISKYNIAKVNGEELPVLTPKWM